jgi:hypothetical protein
LSLGTYCPRRVLDNRALLANFPELAERDIDRVGVHARAEAADD